MLAKLLLVDDDPDTLKLGKMCLESLGAFEVTTANDGEEAVRLARQMHPDAVLLDVRMPGMDGEQTIVELRKDSGTERIPVILITGAVMPRDLERYRQMGARGVIAKPFHAATVIDQVRRLLKR